MPWHGFAIQMNCVYQAFQLLGCCSYLYFPRERCCSMLLVLVCINCAMISIPFLGHFAILFYRDKDILPYARYYLDMVHDWNARSEANESVGEQLRMDLKLQKEWETIAFCDDTGKLISRLHDAKLLVHTQFTGTHTWFLTCQAIKLLDLMLSGHELSNRSVHGSVISKLRNQWLVNKKIK